MDKVMQPKKNLRLTEAEKKILLAYSESYSNGQSIQTAANKLMIKKD